ncbi:MAG: phenylalanine--tRNA ligase subunit alpha [Candidatus Saccharimonadales bacterium]
MTYVNSIVTEAEEQLVEEFDNLINKNDILKSKYLKQLYAVIPTLPVDQKSTFGKDVNNLKNVLLEKINLATQQSQQPLDLIDLTAPYDINTSSIDQPSIHLSSQGSIHPLMQELSIVLDIFYRMGFKVLESKEIDDDFHMFEALNFPKDHPARDDYDTFMTKEGYIAPAHTSTMQHRVLIDNKNSLMNGMPIQFVMPGRVFRNEDIDARHEHTFYQLEGIYVDKNVTVGNLIATLKEFLQTYYKTNLEVKTQPCYFPFTEPSFEFALSCPFCHKKGCSVCSHTGWIELLGCGLIHPKVLEKAGIDPSIYSGFAWGGGIDRLVMMKYDIEDVRHFHSASLDFLRQFS